MGGRVGKRAGTGLKIHPGRIFRQTKNQASVSDFGRGGLFLVVILRLVAAKQGLAARRLGLRLVFRTGDIHRDGDRHFGVQGDLDREQAQRLDRLVQHDMLTLDGMAGRRDGVGDVAGGDRTVEVAISPACRTMTTASPSTLPP